MDSVALSALSEKADRALKPQTLNPKGKPEPQPTRVVSINDTEGVRSIFASLARKANAKFGKSKDE